MVEVLDKSAFGRGYFRRDVENPISPRCSLHLQRICGTCGQSRLQAYRLTKANGCRFWQRKATKNV